MKLLCHKNGINPITAEHVTPITELVAVIRCKHCRHLYNDADTGKACEFSNLGMRPDDYCSYGELREDLKEEGDK